MVDPGNCATEASVPTRRSYFSQCSSTGQPGPRRLPRLRESVAQTKPLVACDYWSANRSPQKNQRDPDRKQEKSSWLLYSRKEITWQVGTSTCLRQRFAP